MDGGVVGPVRGELGQFFVIEKGQVLVCLEARPLCHTDNLGANVASFKHKGYFEDHPIHLEGNISLVGLEFGLSVALKGRGIRKMKKMLCIVHSYSYRFFNNLLDFLEVRGVGVGHRLVVGDVDDLQGEPRAAVGPFVVLRVTFARVLLDHVQLVECSASSLGCTEKEGTFQATFLYLSLNEQYLGGHCDKEWIEKVIHSHPVGRPGADHDVEGLVSVKHSRVTI